MKTTKNIILLCLLGLLGLASHPACAQCSVPANLAVSHITGSAATVTWDYDTTGVGDPSGFTLVLIEANDSTGSSVALFSPSTDDRRWVLTSLDERTPYRIKLAADGCSDTVSILFWTGCDESIVLAINDSMSRVNVMPIRMSSKYSISQQLFTAAETADINAIAGLQFRMVTGLDRTRQLDIYIDTTSQEEYVSSLSTAPGYLLQDSSNLYFSGSVDFTQGWVTLMLDSAFATVAGKGVVLTVVDRTGTTGGVHNFQCSNAGSFRGIFAYGNAAYDVSSTNTMGVGTGAVNYRASIVFLSPCEYLTCAKPYIAVAEPSDDEINLEWFGSGGTSFCVDWRYANSNYWHHVATSTTATTLTIGGLHRNTDYVVRVGNLCVGDTAYDEVAVTTLCGREPIPFSEDFANFTAPSSGDIQRCWHRTASAGNWPQYKNSTFYALSGSGSMEFTRRGALVLPLMQANVDTLAVEFWGASHGNLCYLEVGVASNPADTNTYTVVKTVKIGNVAGTYERHTVYLDSYTGIGEYIFLRDRDNLPLNRSFYIDNLTVDYIPQCRIVEAMTIENVTDSSVTLLIDDEYVHNTYTLRWEADSVADSMTVPPSAVATIGGLQPSTVYSIMVRGNCGTEHSQWTPFTPSTVRTACGAIAVTDSSAYFEDFEAGDLSCMWQLDDSNHIFWSNGTYGNGGGAFMHSGAHAANLRALRPNSAVMLVLPTFDFSQLSGNAELSFWHYQSYTNDFTEEINSAIENGFDIDTTGWHTPAMRVYYRAGVSGPWTFITIIDSLTESLWQKRYVSLPSSQGAATYQVAIQGFGGEYSGFGNYIDDITVGAGSSTGSNCMQPTDITVSNITDHSATVSWSGDAPAYNVQWRKTGSFAWHGYTVSDTTALITPLDITTQYVVRVVALCSLHDESVPSNEVSFYTEFCPEPTKRNNFISADTVSTIAPLYTWPTYSYTEMLIKNYELTGLDVVRGFEFYVVDPIYRLFPNGDTVVDPFTGEKQCTGTRFNDVDIYMSLTSDSVLSNYNFLYSDSTFFQVCSHCDMRMSDTGTFRIIFDNPFNWDGHSNVVLALYQSIPWMGLTDPVQFAGHIGDSNSILCGWANANTYGFSLNPNDPVHYIHVAPGVSRLTTNAIPNLTFLGCKSVCSEPVVASVSSTGSTVTVSWYNENATMQLSITQAGQTDSIGEMVTVSDANSYTFTGLDEMTDYEIVLQNICADGSTTAMVEATTGNGCSVPQMLQLMATSGTTATFGWTDGTHTGDRWEIHVWNDNDFDRYYDVSTNPATIDGLMANDNYHVTVRAYCGDDNLMIGEYSAILDFDNICYPIDSLSAESANGDVVLDWIAGENNRQWIVRYSYANQNLNQQLGYLTVDTNYVSISGLTPGKTYGFRVMPVCDDNWLGPWTDEVSVRVSGVGIDNVKGDAVAIYPNPTTGKTTVSLGSLEGTATLDIIGMDGRILGTYRMESTTLELDLSGYVAGAYFLRLRTTTQNSVHKIVVK